MTAEINELMERLRQEVRQELESELAEKQGQLEEATSEVIRERLAFGAFKTRVTEVLGDFIESGDLDREVANNIAEELGIDKPAGEYTVEVSLTFTLNGVKFSGTEDELDSAVRSQIEVKLSARRDELEYEGEDVDISSVEITAE